MPEPPPPDDPTYQLQGNLASKGDMHHSERRVLHALREAARTSAHVRWVLIVLLLMVLVEGALIVGLLVSGHR